MSTVVRVGIIGGGLMGREMASAFARWCALEESVPIRPELVAVADSNPKALEWFGRIPSVSQQVTDYRDLLDNPAVEVVYVAVPHTLHEEIYKAVLAAGKDLFAEKPFGVDRTAAAAIVSAIQESKRFVRCSSEFPFFPGAQAVFDACQDTQSFGRVLEVSAGFHHASD